MADNGGYGFDPIFQEDSIEEQKLVVSWLILRPLF